MDVQEYFADKKLNIELSYHQDEEEQVYCHVRLRPWKNKPHDGSMVIAAAYETYAALQAAAQLYAAGAWRLLDWAKRTTPDQTDAALKRLAAVAELDASEDQAPPKAPRRLKKTEQD